MGLDHPTPPLRVMRMRGEHMRPIKPASRIVIATDSEEMLLHPAGGAKAINAFNDLIRRYDPDLILSERGDSVLFPALLKIARSEKLQLLLDRDRVFTETHSRITRPEWKDCWNRRGLLGCPCNGWRALCGISANFKCGNV